MAASIRIHAPLALAILMLAACAGNQGISRFAGVGRVWELREMAGQPFAARATISFPEAGRIAGEAPCNSYSARQGAPYPWFEAAAISSTKKACPQLAQEQRFFAALRRMRLSEVSGDLLVLSDEAGENQMVFSAVPR